MTGAGPFLVVTNTSIGVNWTAATRLVPIGPYLSMLIVSCPTKRLLINIH